MTLTTAVEAFNYIHNYITAHRNWIIVICHSEDEIGYTKYGLHSIGYGIEAKYIPKVYIDIETDLSCMESKYMQWDIVDDIEYAYICTQVSEVSVFCLYFLTLEEMGLHQSSL